MTYSVVGNTIIRGDPSLVKLHEVISPNTNVDIIFFSQTGSNSCTTIEAIIKMYIERLKEAGTYGLIDKILMTKHDEKAFMDIMFELHEKYPYAWLGSLIKLKTKRV